VLTREQMKHWLDGFAEADAMNRRAAEFIMNNMERFIRALTTTNMNDATTLFIGLSGEWEAEEANRS
jgi:hypothetical protein